MAADEETEAHRQLFKEMRLLSGEVGPKPSILTPAPGLLTAVVYCHLQGALDGKQPNFLPVQWVSDCPIPGRIKS